MPQSETIPKARTAAQKAVELDRFLAEPHATLGLIAMNYDWSWLEADRHYQQAIALNSNYATAHHWRAEYLAAMGRFDEALAEIRVAEQLDPLSLIISADHGKILYFRPAIRRKHRAAPQNAADGPPLPGSEHLVGIRPTGQTHVWGNYRSGENPGGPR